MDQYTKKGLNMIVLSDSLNVYMQLSSRVMGPFFGRNLRQLLYIVSVSRKGLDETDCVNV